MKKKTVVALEGGINGLTDDDCNSWRDIVIKKLGHKYDFHNPMDFDCRGRELELESELVEFDEKGIASSDILLVNASTGGWGTAMAVQMGHAMNKEIVTIYDQEKQMSPWLHNRSCVVVKSLTLAIEYLELAHKKRNR